MTSRHRSATAVTALTCGAALLGVVACTGLAAASGSGGEGDLAGESAQQISDNALHELVTAQSLRLRTENTADPTKLDLTLDRAGNCAGTISRGTLGRIDLVKRGDQVWMKPDAAFWKSQLPGSRGTAAADTFKGRYLHGTTDDPFLQQLSRACDLAGFQRQAAVPEHPPAPGATPAPALAKGAPTVQDGTRVLPLTRKNDGATQTLYVAIDGPHYPRKLTAASDHETGTILLSDFGRPVPVKIPAPGVTLDISALNEQMQGT
ncbi:hypothetical protein ACWIG3_26955 [Streptomyces celluloflavus]